MKIAVYAISKNEEMFVKRFCESAKDADVIVIADTGSTDKTVELAKECGAQVHNIFISPWRFDMARDAALALVPSDVDICISLDLDEELQPGWREEIERVWKDDTTRLRYKFDWGHGISFFYEKIHARKGYRWHHPCHEYPKADVRIKEVYANTDMLLVVHKPDPTKSRGQYLDLLKASIEEDPLCPRNAFYYARELTFYRKWPEAIEVLKKYLDDFKDAWYTERSYAMRLLGKSYFEILQYDEGFKWYRRACAEAPNTREVWCELAEACFIRRMWAECFAAATNALNIENKEFVYTMDPSVWGYKPHDLLALSAHHLGMKEVAIKHGTIAAEMEPTNERLTQNLEYYKE